MKDAKILVLGLLFGGAVFLGVAGLFTATAVLVLPVVYAAEAILFALLGIALMLSFR
jgi:hypothetical protein